MLCMVMLSVLLLHSVSLYLQACNGTGKKGVVYDYFFQYCPAVTLTNSSWWINFDAGFDYSCTGQHFFCS